MPRFAIITLTVLAVALVPRDARALPAWARKYNMNCSGCHTPAVPRLNAKGYAFKWAGYRMPEEIGEDQEAKRVSDYMAARARIQYEYEKTKGAPATRNEFALGDVTLFAAGSLGKNYGAMLEFEHGNDEVEVMATFVGVWGTESRYLGLRGGQMHWLFEGGVAGFDRPTGISEPTPLGANTTAVPFAFASNQRGIEAFVVTGKNRLSFQVLNGFSADGSTMEAGSVSTKDVVAINQYIYDYAGSGVTAVAYLGAIDGLDTTALIGRTAHYSRLAISANKIFKQVEVLGGYVYSRDRDLPVGSVITTASMSGTGYWVYGGYTMANNPLTVFGRYEFVNPNTDAVREGNTRYVFGGVLPANTPEYLRLAAEYTLDVPRMTAGPKTHGFALQVMFAF